jgi:putative transposase
LGFIDLLPRNWADESFVSGIPVIQTGEPNMRKKQHREDQINYALKRAESGVKGQEVCREMGISEATFYNWKRKYAGMGVGELRRLKQLEEENRKLKGLVADLSLDKHILQEVIAKKL